MVRADEHVPVVRHPDRSRTAVCLSLRPGKGYSRAADGRRVAEGAEGVAAAAGSAVTSREACAAQIEKKFARSYDDFGETTSETVNRVI